MSAFVIVHLRISPSLTPPHPFSYASTITMAEDDMEQIMLPLEGGSEWRFELEAEENIALRVSQASERTQESRDARRAASTRTAWKDSV